MQKNPDLSIVIPVCNEESNLGVLYDRILSVIKPMNMSYEIIFVDDGSRDNSLAVIEELHRKDQNVAALSFSRNFGHMVALSAGLDFSSGRAVITMDADLQHPPELIPELVNKWQAGAEIVSTIRKKTVGAGFLKKISATFFYWMINKIARINLSANAADFRLLDRKVVNTLKNIRERSRFLRGLVSWVGYKQVFIPYCADARLSGKTKYSLSRMIAFSIDGITAFSSFPLRLSIYAGLFIALLNAFYLLYVVYVRMFTGRAIAGWASVLAAVLFIGSVQLIFMGIMGEYLGRVFEETKQRPLYIISRKIGIND